MLKFNSFSMTQQKNQVDIFGYCLRTQTYFRYFDGTSDSWKYIWVRRLIWIWQRFRTSKLPSSCHTLGGFRQSLSRPKRLSFTAQMRQFSLNKTYAFRNVVQLFMKNACPFTIHWPGYHFPVSNIHTRAHPLNTKLN